MNQNIKTLIIISLIIKLILVFVINDALTMNPDEENNYKIAYNSYLNKGYTLYDEETKMYVPTSFDASFPVLTYEYLIRIGIDKEVWIIFIYALMLISFGVSISYFYRLSLLFFEDKKFALYTTITYCFYPSIIFYIGTLFFYENITLPLLVIIIYKLIKALKSSFKKSDYFIIPVVIAFSCLYRPQFIAIYSFIFFVYGLLILKNQYFNLIPLLLITILFSFVPHVPILIKNKNTFGNYFLSTQPGFELLQGHNPSARGSWMGNWNHPESAINKYAESKIDNMADLNEYEQSQARKKVALEWIKENPMSEIKLIFRKLAIYFLPQNLEVLTGFHLYNPINLLTHLFFIFIVFYKIIQRDISENDLMIFSPIVGSLLLSVIFFVGYRWRYYAEPFMIIFAWQFVAILIKNRNISSLIKI